MAGHRRADEAPRGRKEPRLGLDFYARSGRLVARDLIGRVLVRRIGGAELRARIVETEAYLGAVDRASHAFHGRTARTRVLFERPGLAYVYLIYGVHDMLNVVAGRPGEAHAVLLRSAEPLDGWNADLSGPGKLCRALAVTRAENGLDLAGDALHVLRDPLSPRPRIEVSKRIGIAYAGEWRDAPLRFSDSLSHAVTKPRRADLA